MRNWMITFVVALLAATTAGATPVVHTITGGNVFIQVKHNGITLGSTTTALIGDSITIDADLQEVVCNRREELRKSAGPGGSRCPTCAHKSRVDCDRGGRETRWSVS